MSQDEKLLAPHWIVRLFGGSRSTFTLSENGITVCKENGEKFTVLTESFLQDATLDNGLFFSKLILKTDQGEKKFRGLREADAKALFAWLRDYWYQQLAPVITEQAMAIKRILATGYLRTSKWNKVQQLAQQGLKRFGEVPEETCVGVKPHQDFMLVHQIANWNEQDIDAFRDRYVARMKAKHQQYFDSVESNPLTESQKSACIIDEDNNLVLAGAGTGKTSTMIGRAGFLIKEGLAKPNQILMLAFAKKAAEEMQERLEEKIEEQGIKASTFHSLGKAIIAYVEGAQPAISVFAEDEKKLAWQVNEWFEEYLTQSDYKKTVLNYFKNHLYPSVNPFDFQNEGEYFDFIRANDIRTLKGELVKGVGECYVANFLFKMGVEYCYEASYEHATRSLDFRQYKPDFYLPEYGIYIEHVGVDRDGNTAPYVDREKYHEGMIWKRELHKRNKTKLVETYHYDLMEGQLLIALEKSLTSLGVEFNPLPDEAVLATLREFGAVSAFAILLTQLLKRYKANWLTPEELERKIDGLSNNAQMRAALEILDPIFNAYQWLLKNNQEIDFDDMIGKALDYVQAGRFKSPWRYILVDEFQDISDPRAKLVKALAESGRDTSLFCVGDDWQAIYRFTGSDIRFTTAFSEIFGPTKITTLDKTFRFNNSICDVASTFVLKNPSQVKKQLTTHVKVAQPAVSLLRAESNSRKGQTANEDRLDLILQRISYIANANSTVYLLARFGFVLPDPSELSGLRNKYRNLKIDTQTMHASKGKEADYIVVLGLEKGVFGFPSQKVTHPLLDSLLPTAEDYDYSEERRLFYVALTRAKKRVYLVCDMVCPSEFIEELIDDKYPIDLNEFEITFMQRFAELIRCIQCETGAMLPRAGKKGDFYGCSNYPLCNYAENGCKTCGSPFQHLGRFKVCTNPDCASWVPTCLKCGAEMIKRNGRNGEFWGCRNYRGSEDVSCSATENTIEYIK